VDGFILRYRTEQHQATHVDGLPPGEGAFLACTFWLADNLLMLGRKEDANVLFKRLLSIRNDVGLLPEEYEPQLKRFVGNFPQAFSHVALINSACNLCDKTQGPAQERNAA
jgi:GH15 family glucan-1,4-alpha-glucosidase